jgi:hypothetical protein
MSTKAFNTCRARCVSQATRPITVLTHIFSRDLASEEKLFDNRWSQVSSTYRSRSAIGASDRQAQSFRRGQPDMCKPAAPMHSISIPAISSRLGSSASLLQLLKPRGNTFVPQHRAAFRRGISPCTLLQASPPPDSTSHTPPRRQSPAHTAFLTSDGRLLRPANQFAHRSASLNGQPNGLTCGSSRGARL